MITWTSPYRCVNEENLISENRYSEISKGDYAHFADAAPERGALRR
jgi:hypothetical protein